MKGLIMKRKIIILLIILFIITSLLSYSKTVAQGLKNSVLRLHVIANSDSIEDQNLKLKVRDRLICYMNTLNINTNSKEECIEILKKNFENFKKIAVETIHDEGFDYDVSIEYGDFDFPTKKYGDISFPAGKYDAIRIKIGNASGQNWWCVMFPPLCFTDTTTGIVPEESKKILKNELSDEEYTLISDTSKPTKIKFKIIEFFNNIF